MSIHPLRAQFNAASLRVMLQTCLWLTFLTIGAACLLLTACTVSEEVAVVTIAPTLPPTATMTETAVPPTLTPTHTATATPSPTPTRTPKPTRTPLSTPTTKATPLNTPEPGQGEFSLFQQRTLAELRQIASHSTEGGVEDVPKVYVEIDWEYMYPSLARVIYTGEFRELDSVRKFIIETWADMYPPEDARGIIEAFQHEVLVTENGVDYWLPLPEYLMPIMQDEVASGSEMDVFVMFIGADTFTEEGNNEVFLLSVFRKVTQSSDTSTPAPASSISGQPRTLTELERLSSESVREFAKGSKDPFPYAYIETAEEYMYPSFVWVNYTGEFREIDPTRKIIIQVWSDAFAPDFKDYFQHEVLVTESGVDYWMPIQEEIVNVMKDEVEVGGEMGVFIMFIGSNVLSEEKMEHVYILNGFQLAAP